MKMMSIVTKIGVCFFSLILLATSCKKFADPPPYFEAYGEDSTGAQRKVLIISMDGVSGDVIKAAKLPNITKLSETGKYSYSVIKSAVNTNAATWATLLTGVGYSKHMIHDSSFQYVPSGDVSEGEDESTPYFPNALNYVLQNKPNYKTAVITPWLGLSKYSRIADFPISVSGDALVKDSAIRLLKENTLGVMILDFNSTELAGNAGAHSLSDKGYTAALHKVDVYIGDVIKALKARETYNNEDWLIMVTTNRGGREKAAKNGFVIISNPKLKREELNKIGFNTVHYNGKGEDAVTSYVPDDKGLYNMGADKDFTMQIQINFATTIQYPGFIGKSTGISGSNTTGWTFMQIQGKYAVVFGGSDNGGSGKQQINATIPVADGKWHTITLTVKTTDGKRVASLYTDGKFDVSADITARGNLDTERPLTVGYNKIDASGASDFHAAGLELFNVALDEKTIAANTSLKDITKHPQYKHLIGYWPIEDGGGGLVANVATGGYDMQLAGPFKWDALGTDVPANIEPVSSLDPSVVPAPVDIIANMLYWLKIEVLSDWKLDGSSWLVKFEREIYQQ